MRRFIPFLFVAVLSATSATAGERTLLTPLAKGGTLATTPAVSADLQSLKQRATSSGRVKVIVGLRVPFAPEGTLSRAERSAQRVEIGTAALALRKRFATTLKSRPTAIRSYSTLPFAALEVTPQELAQLAADPQVVSVMEDPKLRPNLDRSAPLIRAPEAWAAGFSGAGQTIAIIDTGVDKDHPFLAGKVVSEACYGGFCPGGATSSVAPGSGKPCPLTEECDHGTHVAGIAAGRGVSASGIARDANLIAIQVFSPDPEDPTSTVAYGSDILAGLNRVLELRGTFNIAAANLSLGGGYSKRTCDTYYRPFTAAVLNLRSVGIATVVAAGNEGLTSALSFPACISSTVSVGSVSASDTGLCDGVPNAVDKVACYSNTASFLSLLAPGTGINSSIPGGDYATFSGTSMATPHVAGAWAIMRQRYPDAPVTDLLAALQATGKPVADTRLRRPIIKSRIDVAAALGGLAQLTVTPAGGGTGTVRLSTKRGGVITCGPAACNRTMATGTLVKLTAKADRGSRFTGWSIASCGKRSSCSFTLSGAQAVTANFVPR